MGVECGVMQSNDKQEAPQDIHWNMFQPWLSMTCYSGTVVVYLQQWTSNTRYISSQRAHHSLGHVAHTCH